MFQRRLKRGSKQFSLVGSEGRVQNAISSVKRKLFVDADACSSPKRLHQWTPAGVYRQEEIHYSDSDDWHSGSDSQENFSESSLSDSSLLQSPNLKSEDAFDAEPCEEDNFRWLLNFKVGSLFQNPCEYSVANDRKCRSSEFESSDVMMENQDLSPEGEYSAPSVCGKRKPPYTYTELIELALHDKGELTVSGIYKWIMDHFPFFQAADDRWKNSVRHNLSINANFKKGRKPQGSSHLWTIATDSEKKFKQESMGQTNKSLWKKKAEITGLMSIPDQSLGDDVDLEMNENHEFLTINKSAEEILNGHIEKKVEVQLVTPLRPFAYKFLLESREFLNPVTRKEVVQESGLLDDTQVVHSLPQQIFNSLCSEMEPSGELFGEDLTLNYLNISP